MFFIPYDNCSLIWTRHYYRSKATKIYLLVTHAYGFCAFKVSKCATPTPF